MGIRSDEQNGRHALMGDCPRGGGQEGGNGGE